jgi:hypothetical protein
VGVKSHCACSLRYIIFVFCLGWYKHADCLLNFARTRLKSITSHKQPRQIPHRQNTTQTNTTQRNTTHAHTRAFQSYYIVSFIGVNFLCCIQILNSCARCVGPSIDIHTAGTSIVITYTSAGSAHKSDASSTGSTTHAIHMRDTPRTCPLGGQIGVDQK